MTNEDIEQEIQAKGLTAPRVTPADIEANIVHTEIIKHITPSGQVLRWAVLTLKNGFAATGAPSCSVSPENDDEEIGKEYAIINAKETLWPLMGYALKQRLHDDQTAKSVRSQMLGAECEAALAAGLPLMRDPIHPYRLIVGDPDKFSVTTIDSAIEASGK